MTLVDYSLTELVAMWRANRKTEVVRHLAESHPCKTANLIVQGAQSPDLEGGRLMLTECNEIANLLTDSLTSSR